LRDIRISIFRKFNTSFQSQIINNFKTYVVTGFGVLIADVAQTDY
jgi:hypothetical protein